MASYSVVLIGNSAVGKSSILARFADEELPGNRTIGVDFRHKEYEIDGIKFKLIVWDRAMAERTFTYPIQHFRMGKDGCIIVYDVTCEESFDSIYYWTNEIRTHNSTMQSGRIFLLANKIDRTEERVISRDRGLIIADELGLSYFETSALTNTNIKLVFYILASDIIYCNKINNNYF